MGSRAALSVAVLAATAMVVAASATAQASPVRPKNLAFPPGAWIGAGVKTGAPFKTRAPLELELTVGREGSVEGELEIGGPLPTPPNVHGATGHLRLEVTGKLGGDARKVSIVGRDTLKGTITAPLDNPLTHKRTYHTVHLNTFLPLRSQILVDTATCQKVTGTAYFRFGPVKFTAVRKPGSKPATLTQTELIDRYAELLAAFRDARNPKLGKAVVEDLIDKTQAFLVVLAQAKACGKVPPGFENGLPGLEELVDDVGWMDGVMLLAGFDHPSLDLIQNTAASFATLTWIELLDLALEARTASPSAPEGSDARNFSERFGVILGFKLQAAIKADDKAQISLIQDAATRAGLTALAARAGKALK